MVPNLSFKPTGPKLHCFPYSHFALARRLNSNVGALTILVRESVDKHALDAGPRSACHGVNWPRRLELHCVRPVRRSWRRTRVKLARAPPPGWHATACCRLPTDDNRPHRLQHHHWPASPGGVPLAAVRMPLVPAVVNPFEESTASERAPPVHTTGSGAFNETVNGSICVATPLQLYPAHPLPQHKHLDWLRNAPQPFVQADRVFRSLPCSCKAASLQNTVGLTQTLGSLTPYGINQPCRRHTHLLSQTGVFADRAGTRIRLPCLCAARTARQTTYVEAEDAISPWLGAPHRARGTQQPNHFALPGRRAVYKG